MEEDLQQAIEKCQQGKLKYFADIYDHYLPEIYRFVFYRVGDTSLAEDLTSDIFVKILENINKNKKIDFFKAWIYRIARNRVIDYYRTKKDKKNIDDVWDLSDNDWSRIEDNVRLGEIKQYMQHFSHEQREMLTMRIWDGLSYAEIAQIFNKNEGAVKMKVKRGLDKIRQEFGPEIVSTFIIFSLLNK